MRAVPSSPASSSSARPPESSLQAPQVPFSPPVIAAAAASGAAGGGVGEFLIHRFGGRAETWAKEGLDHGGLVLWVFLREDEQKVTGILKKAGGTDVRVQDAPKPWLEPAHRPGAPHP